MMKKTRKKTTIGMMILGFSLLAAPSFAMQDYSSMTNEEMAALRGTMRDSSQEERAAFQGEWQSRVNNMSPEERQQAITIKQETPRLYRAMRTVPKQTAHRH